MTYDQEKYDAEHHAMYAGFMRLTKYSSIVIVITLILMAIFLT